ncbi:hypothetical protein DYB30_012692 [Aphanomyces astaci]|uniref:Uncharacterized protein n=1 Tax=Aphanomyces astaci TaxID=112090 RepID=A0A397CKR9_APHAT|nr:hypothetical protein DYB30_012692 [Aphanomyces astaci]
MQEQKVIQFIDTVVLPRHNASREAFFDGKIGMWHFVRHRPAERNSRNRSADTMVTTLVNVDGRVCTNYILNKVVPAIKAKFQSDIKKLNVVDPTLSETERDPRLAEIKAHTTTIQHEVIDREATKKFTNQCSAVHNFLVSAI